MLLCELTIDAAEVGCVSGSEIGRCFHSRENHLDISRLCTRDDLCEVLLQTRHWKTSQPVVGAELDDEDLHIARERPLEAIQPSCGGITRDTSVDDFVRISRILQSLLNERRNRLVLPKTIPRGQAVTEEYDSRCGTR